MLSFFCEKNLIRTNIQVLREMGWDGIRIIPKQKSFVIELSIKIGTKIGFMIRLIDYDSGSHSYEEKIAGGAAFKCDIDFAQVKKDMEFWEQGQLLAKELVLHASYEGRGPVGL